MLATFFAVTYLLVVSSLPDGSPPYHQYELNVYNRTAEECSIPRLAWARSMADVMGIPQDDVIISVSQVGCVPVNVVQEGSCELPPPPPEPQPVPPPKPPSRFVPQGC